MKALVTGGGGFLGSYIVRDLLQKNYEVVSLSRNTYSELTKKNVLQIQCDLSLAEEVKKLDLSSFDVIFHVASKAGVWGKYEDYYRSNFIATKNLVDQAKEQNVKYFIYTSTPSVVFGKDDICNGDEKMQYPEHFYTHYAYTKMLAEKYVIENNFNDFKTLAIRPHLIWGPGDPHLIPRLKQKAMNNKLKQVGDGENLVDIIYVENASLAHVQAFEALMKRNIGGRCYFIGQENAIKLWGFINQVLEKSNLNPVQSQVSEKLAFNLGYVFEKIFSFFGIQKPEPPMTRFVAMQLAKSHYFSHEAAKNDFDYKIKYTIEEGLERTFG